MSPSPKTIEIILEAAADVPTIRTRKMFGEYALYVDENDWDDREYITELLLATADSLPLSKPKKKSPSQSATI